MMLKMELCSQADVNKAIEKAIEGETKGVNAKEIIMIIQGLINSFLYYKTIVMISKSGKIKLSYYR